MTLLEFYNHGCIWADRTPHCVINSLPVVYYTPSGNIDILQNTPINQSTFSNPIPETNLMLSTFTQEHPWVGTIRPQVHVRRYINKHPPTEKPINLHNTDTHVDRGPQKKTQADVTGHKARNVLKESSQEDLETLEKRS
jgi:hypothetical protein